jgi:hypothetical protein
MPAANPNHHLWRNGRLWWIAFTVIYDGWRQERIRRSLGTADLEEARRRRDHVLYEYATHPGAEVAALRAIPVRGDETTPFRVEPALAASGGFGMRGEESHA